MIKTIYKVTGLSGTGKTFFVKSKLERESDRSHQALFLTFNKGLEESFNSLKENTNFIAATVHSLCCKILEEQHQLPLVFNKVKTNSKLKLKSSDFDLLINSYINLCKKQIVKVSILKDVSTIICDEYQNFDRRLIQVIKCLALYHNFDLYLVGDPYQNIYGYEKNHRGIKSNFEFIKDDYSIEPSESIVLNQNHRLSEELKGFINSFLFNSFNDSTCIQYKVDIDVSEDESHKPTIVYYSNMEEEANYIVSHLERLNKDERKNVLILYRYKCDSIILKKKLKEKSLEVKCSSIHQSIGTEASKVIYMGFQVPLSVEEKKVAYVGMTRAKDYLLITSPYPIQDLSNTFYPATYSLNNHQEHFEKEYKKLKSIKDKKNFSIQKYSSCLIDSIELKVPFNKVPYAKYIDGKIRQEGFVKVQIEEYKGVVIAIKQHNRFKNYQFELLDTNFLRKNGYNDKQMLLFLTNYIEEFFDYRVKLEDIELKRVDLYKLEQEEKIGKLLEEIQGKGKWVDKDGKEVSSIRQSINTSAVYWNLRKNRDFVISIYKPFNKENFNKVFNKKIIKIEVRLKGKIVDKYLQESIEKIVGSKSEVVKDMFDNMFKKIIEERVEKSWGYFIGKNEWIIEKMKEEKDKVGVIGKIEDNNKKKRMVG